MVFQYIYNCIEQLLEESEYRGCKTEPTKNLSLQTSIENKCSQTSIHHDSIYRAPRFNRAYSFPQILGLCISNVNCKYIDCAPLYTVLFCLALERGTGNGGLTVYLISGLTSFIHSSIPAVLTFPNIFEFSSEDLMGFTHGTLSANLKASKM